MMKRNLYTPDTFPVTGVTVSDTEASDSHREEERKSTDEVSTLSHYIIWEIIVRRQRAVQLRQVTVRLPLQSHVVIIHLQ